MESCQDLTLIKRVDPSTDETYYFVTLGRIRLTDFMHSEKEAVEEVKYINRSLLNLIAGMIEVYTVTAKQIEKAEDKIKG